MECVHLLIACERVNVKHVSIAAAIGLPAAAFMVTACTSSEVPETDSPAPLVEAVVVGVIDGITIEVEADGRVSRVRYLGVEIPDTGRVEPSGQQTAEEAWDFNRFLVEGKTVELEKGLTEVDQSGQLLRYVYVNGEMVNLALLTNGYATVASFPAKFKYLTSFLIAEENAEASLRGVWSLNSVKDDHSSPTPSFSGGTLPKLPEEKRSLDVCDYSDSNTPVIKGNVDSRTGERIYHVPDGFFYSTTVVDESAGDRWLCTEEEAVEAGWKKSKR